MTVMAHDRHRPVAEVLAEITSVNDGRHRDRQAGYASERYYERPVPAAATVSAAEMISDGSVPLDALSSTIGHAVLHELATGLQLDRSTRDGRKPHVAGPADAPGADVGLFGITPGVARMLDWFVRRHPASAGRAMGAITGEAERRLGIPRDATEHSLAVALDLDGKLGHQALQEFLRRVVIPGSGREQRRR